MSLVEEAFGLLSWDASFRTLGMISKSAEKGFTSPYFSKRIGHALVPKGQVLEAVMGFERAGLFGYKSAQQQMTKKFGASIAANASKRFLLGRAAGLVLGFSNIAFWGGLALQGSAMAYGTARDLTEKYKGLELGGYFADTQGAYTSRQRAVRAITTSQLQARSAIGNEAMLMHR